MTQCDVTANTSCPTDSLARVTVNVDDPCVCPTTSTTCQCLDCPDPQDVLCAEGYLKVMTREGQGLTGECCDEYECLPRGEFTAWRVSKLKQNVLLLILSSLFFPELIKLVWLQFLLATSDVEKS